jgi:hypothetical protein
MPQVFASAYGLFQVIEKLFYILFYVIKRFSTIIISQNRFIITPINSRLLYTIKPMGSMAENSKSFSAEVYIFSAPRTLRVTALSEASATAERLIRWRSVKGRARVARIVQRLRRRSLKKAGSFGIRPFLLPARCLSAEAMALWALLAVAEGWRLPWWQIVWIARLGHVSLRRHWRTLRDRVAPIPPA